MEIEFEALHLLVLALTAVVIVFADHEGWQYVRGKKAVLSTARVQWLHRAVWVGLLGMIMTGIGLTTEEPEVFEEPMFYVKMVMVLALIINGVAISFLSKVATTTPFASLTTKQRVPLFISGAVSVGCWIGAALLGFTM